MNAQEGPELLSAEAYLSLPDSDCSELVDGRIVRMTPSGARHGALEFALASVLRDHIEPRGLGWVLVGEVGLVVRRNPDQVLGADIVVVARERVGDALPDGFLGAPPAVLVEILSPGHRRREMEFKVPSYLNFGVRQVWVLDPARREVHVIEATQRTVHRTGDVLRPTGLLAGMEIDIAALVA